MLRIQPQFRDKELFCDRWRVLSLCNWRNSSPAKQEKVILLANDTEAEGDGTKIVVIKLMQDREQYAKEIHAHGAYDFSADFVLPLLHKSEDEQLNEKWANAVSKLGYDGHHFGVIMEYADRSLDTIMRQVHLDPPPPGLL